MADLPARCVGLAFRLCDFGLGGFDHQEESRERFPAVEAWHLLDRFLCWFVFLNLLDLKACLGEGGQIIAHGVRETGYAEALDL
ncbi:hypothetical protein PsAD5_01807 [Pseudovibrio sp. Ad5]|nr:hypothetical protein PsAD5_01807 [Pseudovibrio sp. Ad5]